MAKHLKDNGQFVVLIAGIPPEPAAEPDDFPNFLVPGLAIAMVMMIFVSLVNEAEQHQQEAQNTCQTDLLSRRIDDLFTPCPTLDPR
jgi:hypothetical protein